MNDRWATLLAAFDDVELPIHSAAPQPVTPAPTTDDEPVVVNLDGLDATDLSERAAMVEEGAGVPRSWGEGYAALSSMRAPAGFAPERWRRIVDGAGSFVDRWAVRAAAAGWSDLDIFGAHPVAPDARFDCMGLVLLLDRAEVVGIDQGGADLEARSPDRIRTRFYRRPLPQETVSLWKLAVTAAKHGDAEI